jgi:hypothetical protein
MKYMVKVYDVFATFFDMEAESKDEAKSKVLELIMAGEVRQESFFETTLEPELWQVLSFDDITKQKEDFKEKYDEYIKKKKEEAKAKA